MTEDLEDRPLEGNMARLLQAALGGEAQLRPELRRQTLGRLLAEMRARPAAVAFPDTVVVLLGGVLALAACGLALLAADGGAMAWNASPVLLLLAAGLALNLAVMPISGVVIVLRRYREQAS